MTLALTDYRSDVYNQLAAAADASKWTPAMLDDALRLALNELNTQLVYETSFTVTVAGFEQDLSGITAINAVLAVAYPWVDGAEFGHCVTPFRFTGVNQIYFTNAEPAVDEVIRVRYSKLHTIQNLDSAAATLVTDAHRALLGLTAAAIACEMRYRQAGEQYLLNAAEVFRRRAQEALSHVPPLGRLRWGSLGLD